MQHVLAPVSETGLFDNTVQVNDAAQPNTKLKSKLLFALRQPRTEHSLLEATCEPEELLMAYDSGRCRTDTRLFMIARPKPLWKELIEGLS